MECPHAGERWSSCTFTEEYGFVCRFLPARTDSGERHHRVDSCPAYLCTRYQSAESRIAKLVGAGEGLVRVAALNNCVGDCDIATDPRSCPDRDKQGLIPCGIRKAVVNWDKAKEVDGE